ncbi:hypothetical protein [Methanobacterium spitsbergense]
MSKAKYVISSYPTSKSPYYWVDVLNTDNYIGPGGMVKINAITGEVLKGT